MNKFVRELNGFYRNNFHHLDTASLYIERIFCNVLNNAKLVGCDLYRGKNDYRVDKFIFYGSFLAPKIKFVLTVEKYGIIQAFKTFKGFTDSKRLVDHVQCF